MISSVTLEDGSRLEGPEQVHQGAVLHFQSFLSLPNNVEELDLSSLIETNISEEENSILCQIPSEDRYFWHYVLYLRRAPKGRMVLGLVFT